MNYNSCLRVRGGGGFPDEIDLWRDVLNFSFHHLCVEIKLDAADQALVSGAFLSLSQLCCTCHIDHAEWKGISRSFHSEYACAIKSGKQHVTESCVNKHGSFR